MLAAICARPPSPTWHPPLSRMSSHQRVRAGNILSTVYQVLLLVPSPVHTVRSSRNGLGEDSNLRPRDDVSRALPTELPARVLRYKKLSTRCITTHRAKQDAAVESRKARTIPACPRLERLLRPSMMGDRRWNSLLYLGISHLPVQSDPQHHEGLELLTCIADPRPMDACRTWYAGLSHLSPRRDNALHCPAPSHSYPVTSWVGNVAPTMLVTRSPTTASFR